MRLRKMFRRKRAIIFEDLRRPAFAATALSFAEAKKIMAMTSPLRDHKPKESRGHNPTDAGQGR